MASRTRELFFAQILLRLSLGAGLLSAVADRFGLWGHPGHASVAWGNFSAFLSYTARLNPWCPRRFVAPLGWAVTVAETALGIALVAGYRPRWTALLVAAMTVAFGIAMTVVLGPEAPLNYSVFTFAAGAYLLSCLSKR